MRFVDHPTCNFDLNSPKGLEDKVGTLRAEVAMDPELGPRMKSFWKPTAEEIALLQADGFVTLTVFGRGHPVVAIGAEGPVEAPPAEVMCGGSVYQAPDASWKIVGTPWPSVGRLVDILYVKELVRRLKPAKARLASLAGAEPVWHDEDGAVLLFQPIFWKDVQ